MRCPFFILLSSKRSVREWAKFILNLIPINSESMCLEGIYSKKSNKNKHKLRVRVYNLVWMLDFILII